MPIQSSGKKQITNMSSIENTLQSNPNLYDQPHSSKKTQEKDSSAINQILEMLKKKLTCRGIRGLFGMAKQFRVNTCIITMNRYLTTSIKEH